MTAIGAATTAGQQRQEEYWSTTFQEKIARPGRDALHKFFYPPRRSDDLGGSASSSRGTSSRGTSSSQLPPPAGIPPPPPHPDDSPRPRTARSGNGATGGGGNDAMHQRFDEHFQEQEVQDKKYVERFWTTFDDIIILSLFTQLGIVFRLGASIWFTYFDNVFTNNSALFVNLPLNCFSCFIMGMLSSGDRLMQIIGTRFTPPHLQQELQRHNLDETEREEEKDVIGLVSGNGVVGGVDYSDEEDDDEFELVNGNNSNGMRRRRRGKRKKAKKKKKKAQQYFHSWQPPLHLHDELRDVQLLALERRIRASKCLVLFPIRKEDVDVMEHYFHEGYKRHEESDHDYDPEMDRPGDDPRDFSFDLALEESIDETAETLHRRYGKRKDPTALAARLPSPASTDSIQSSVEESKEEIQSELVEDSKPKAKTTNTSNGGAVAVDSLTGSLQRHAYDEEHAMTTVDLEEPDVVTRTANNGMNGIHEAITSPNEQGIDQELHGETQYDLDQILHEVSANVTENVSRLRRVNLADGWDVGTTPEAMSDDLMLGLRDGFCGAVSSFSSWNSAMVNLLRGGQIGEALVGYVLGLQLPIVAYRFGQHIAVYIFIWRARRETRSDERRGYGIRVALNEFTERDSDGSDQEHETPDSPDSVGRRKKEVIEMPSVRAIATAIFLLALVTQCTSLSFFSDPGNQQLALSLLFSPLGVLARWRLSKYNNWRPSFPIGTFTANILACAMSGGLGTILAGNPGPRERIVLVSFIAGFGGTLSSLATFIVEILAGVDPVLLRFDGIVYAMLSIFWATFTGFIFSASADWADTTD